MKFSRSTLILTLAIAPLGCLSQASAAPLTPTEIMAPVQALHPSYRLWPAPAGGETAQKNPPLLTWPKGNAEKRSYTVRLSMDKAFSPDRTMEASGLEWALFHPGRVLEAGRWFWQVRSGEGPWSDTYEFNIGSESAPWNPPTAASLLEAIPSHRPRLLVDAPEWETFRLKALTLPEAAHVIRDAEVALETLIPVEDDGIHELTGRTADESRKLRLDASEVIGQAVYDAILPLCQAYVLTGEARFAEAAVKWALAASEWDPKGVTHLSNFSDSRIMLSMALVVDTCEGSMTPQDKARIAGAAATRANNFFKLYVKTAQEIKAVSGHFWQHILHYLFDTAIALHGEDPRADRWLAFCYETFLARAPLLGGEDGGWAEGISYFRMNMEMLFDIPWRIRDLTGFDFISHTPWYAENTDLLLYAFPPGSASAGFADNTHDLLEPKGDYFAYADVLGRVMKNPYASWYHARVAELTPELTPFYQAYWRYHNVKEWDSDQETLGDTRRFRWSRLRYLYESPRVSPASPEALPMARVFEGEGLIALHGQPLGTNPDINFFVAMRASPMGASGHMLADQNCFNMVYGGERLFYHTGYKVAMSAPHRRQYYMTTKSHNGILVDGEGQPCETEAFAWVEHFLDESDVAYAVGNASHAYDSEKAGVDAGVRGFKRHLLMLRPDILVIYDELEAVRPVSWTYLLHSYEPIEIEASAGTLRTQNGKGSAVVRLDASAGMEWAVTHEYPVPAVNWRKIKDENGKLLEYPDNAWHFSASTDKLAKVRFVGIYKVSPTSTDGKLLHEAAVEKDGGVYRVGDWEIRVALNTEERPGLIARRMDGGVVFASPGMTLPELETGEETGSARLLVRESGGWRTLRSEARLPPGSQRAIDFYKQIAKQYQ
jgi:hypothetical protein